MHGDPSPVPARVFRGASHAGAVSLFGSSGIRGIANREITPELALAAGKAVGSLQGNVIVGRDPRLSGLMLADAFIAGALSTGADATEAGIVSTPTLARGAAEYNAGVVVTASHNPAPYNGLKFWNPDGMAFDEEQQAGIEAAMERGEFPKADWRGVGQRHTRWDLVRHHMDAILRECGSAAIKVVVDCGCGATGAITPFVLQRMGCKVVALNAQPDGHFPGRDPEPSEENLSVLKHTVVAAKADLGIAHDGDGDRMVAIDEAGRFAGGDRLLPLFAKAEARHAIVVPFDASLVLDDLLPGIAVHRTRVGDVYVASELKRRKADFGGEPSGTWIFPSSTLCPDGVLAAARLTAMVAEQRLSDRLAEIPHYPLLRGSVPFEPANRREIEAGLGVRVAALGGRVERFDGWRVAFDDGWLAIRLSGTEPKVRIAAEARTEARAKEIYELAVTTVKAVL